MQVAAGHFGQQPSPADNPFEFTITTVGRLTKPEEFEDIVVRTDSEGRMVRIKDIGRAVLGARNLDTTSKLDGRPNASIAIFALPDANSIATAQRVRAKLDELKEYFPDDIEYEVSLDMTPFIQESIYEVVRTLIEAVVLVAIVVLIFLQNWRSALIALIAVPVAIVGTFAVMAIIGFSLNNLTLFGLVLAIGIVVDDAIVVVEAIEHHIEEGLSPRQVAHFAMWEVSSPVIAVALVLTAVFVPCAFITGITGQFFRQFALTIAVSTVISAFNSLTLSPALAALLLPVRGAKKDWFGRLLDLTLGWFFRLFNWGFRRSTSLYIRVVSLALRGSVIVLVVYGGLLLLTWWTSRQLPSGYIPNQDQGRFYIALQLPDSASVERTQKVVDRIAEIVGKVPGVIHTTGIAGQSFTLNANGTNFGQFFVTLDEYDKRHDPELHAFKFVDRVKAILDKELPETMATLFTPPPVSGLGSAGGFKIIIEDRGDLGFEELQKQIDRIMANGNAGHFKLTEQSLAELRGESQPVPAALLEKLDALKDKDFLTKEQFSAALGEVFDAAAITNTDQRAQLQKQVLNHAVNTKVVNKLFSVFRATRLSSMSTSIANSARPWGSTPATCSTRCRSTSARYTSTMSTCSAGPGRSLPRSRASSAMNPAR